MADFGNHDIQGIDLVMLRESAVRTGVALLRRSWREGGQHDHYDYNLENRQNKNRDPKSAPPCHVHRPRLRKSVVFYNPVQLKV